MAKGVVLEFDGVGREQYDAVNARLGIDAASGTGDWPPGLLYHAAGSRPGGWVVFEVWDSEESQQRFMQDRLAAALQDGGITGPPSRVDWFDVVAHTSPPG